MRIKDIFSRIMGRKRHSATPFTLLATDYYFDLLKGEKQGGDTALYRMPNGVFFTLSMTQGYCDRALLNILPKRKAIGLCLHPLDYGSRMAVLTEAEAIELYEGPLTEHAIDYEMAFPGVQVEDA